MRNRSISLQGECAGWSGSAPQETSRKPPVARTTHPEPLKPLAGTAALLWAGTPPGPILGPHGSWSLALTEVTSPVSELCRWSTLDICVNRNKLNRCQTEYVEPTHAAPARNEVPVASCPSSSLEPGNPHHQASSQ